MNEDVKKELDQMFQAHTDTVRAKIAAASEGATAKAAEAREKADRIEADIAAKLKDMQAKQIEHQSRILSLEQKGVGAGPLSLPGATRSVGQMFVESDQFQSARAAGLAHTGKVNIGSFHVPIGATAIVNATGQNQPLVPDMRVPGIITPGLRRMTVRSLLPQGRTTSNMVQYVKENSFTNAAAPQGAGSSPQVYENVAKAESALTFTLENAAVQTLAHWIPASRQILDDAPMLQSYIDSRLRYGLQEEEEDQLLLGDGTGANLSGLVTEATAYDTTLNGGSDTQIDKLRHAVYQVTDSEYVATGIVLNHKDWHDIQLLKTTGTASSGEYIFSNPHVVERDVIWGLPVVPTNAMTEGEFLVGAFALAAQIWDRADATVEISREHSDYFVKNMVAILAEERLTLTVYRPLALVYGSF